MILPFYCQLHFYTFGYHRKHYNQHHVAWPQHRLAQLVDHKFLIFHQFLDCILLCFLNHYNISPSQLLFYPSMEARDVQTHQEQYQLLCPLRLPLGQADLVSLLDKLKLFYSTFSTSAPKHKSTIFGSFITRRFYTFCLLLLFNTIRFHHYYIFMLNKIVYQKLVIYHLIYKTEFGVMYNV